MIDPQRYASLLCDWCLEVAPGQAVVIDTETVAEPAVAALCQAIYARGGWPQASLRPPGEGRWIYDHGSDLHLDEDSPFRKAIFTAMDAYLRIEAPTNLAELNGIDAARRARRTATARPLTDLRMSKRWAVSIWPTAALAQEAGMSLVDYSAFLERALFLDRPDPVAAWQQLGGQQQTLVDRLSSARQVRVVNARTDITLDVSGRTWRNSDGRRNMPSGEVFTSPHETSATGHVHFDIPSQHGGLVQGVSLTFRDGEVTAARAEQGDARLQAELALDPGARRLGEIGIGTNFGIDRATGSTLLDEKIGGTIHLALGHSYPECGGQNESATHWDLVCDLRPGGEIIVDGEVIARDGVFL